MRSFDSPPIRRIAQDDRAASLYNTPMEKPMLILSVDTSLDDTSAAITLNDSVVSNVVSSQVELHKKWGGVVPIIAKRAHEERIEAVINEALKRATVQLKKTPFSSFVNKDLLQNIDVFAVTQGPGQAPALEVGIRHIKALAEKYDKPLIAVNHMEGHLLSSFAKNAEGKGSIISQSFTQAPQGGATTGFPLLGLLISGGHTQLVLVKDFGDYELLGETLDDAIGEAFDKVGRMFDLGYPGGPIIERLAKEGDEKAFKLPIPMRKRTDENYNFSYSGIKTALMYLVKDIKEKNQLDRKTICDLAASFQYVVTLSLIDKLELAVKNTHPKGILLGGGVISNLYIRNRIRSAMKKHTLPVYIPYSKKLFTDNAAMIGVAAFYQSLRNDFVKDPQTLDRTPNLSF